MSRLPLPVMDTHDNQMMSDWAYCPRYYAVRHRRNLVPKSQDKGVGSGSVATRYGALLHNGLDVFYKHLIKDKNLAAATYAAIMTVRNDKEFGDDPIEDFRTRGRAEHDILEYAKQYGLEVQWDILLTETPFDIADSEGFKYGGRIDLSVKYHGNLWNVDHKTTTRFGQYYFDNYKLSPQMMGYTWATSQLHGREVSGAIINVIVLHKGKTEFHRRPILYSRNRLDIWRERAIARYWQIYSMIEKDPTGERAFDVDVWTPNFENCIGKYGPCPMFKVCDSLPQNYEVKLSMGYEVKKWDWTHAGEDSTGE